MKRYNEIIILITIPYVSHEVNYILYVVRKSIQADSFQIIESYVNIINTRIQLMKHSTYSMHSLTIFNMSCEYKSMYIQIKVAKKNIYI
jgi:hypothetical protein